MGGGENGGWYITRIRMRRETKNGILKWKIDAVERKLFNAVLYEARSSGLVETIDD